MSHKNIWVFYFKEGFVKRGLISKFHIFGSYDTIFIFHPILMQFFFFELIWLKTCCSSMSLRLQRYTQLKVANKNGIPKFELNYFKFNFNAVFCTTKVYCISFTKGGKSNSQNLRSEIEPQRNVLMTLYSSH
jgi:hypothetical protein